MFSNNSVPTATHIAYLSYKNGIILSIESGQQRVDVVELQIFAKIYDKDIKYFVK